MGGRSLRNSKRDQERQSRADDAEGESCDESSDNVASSRDFEPADISERRGLLPPPLLYISGNSSDRQGKKKRPEISLRRKLQDLRLRYLIDPSRSAPGKTRDDWMRPYWLGLGLFLVLFPFWLLDTLKDPVFGALTGGNLQQHLPKAKLLSVCTTLALVCFLEYVAQERKRAAAVDQQLSSSSSSLSREQVLAEGGPWNRMGIATTKTTTRNSGGHGLSHYFHHDWATDENTLQSQQQQASSQQEDADVRADAEDRVPSRIFASIGVPYCIFFAVMAYLLQFNPATAWTAGSSSQQQQQQQHDTATTSSSNLMAWQVLGYCLYAAIESFGSLAVATFWSYTNSTLALQDAETYYGTIIAFAQMGAIAGSTMVTMHVWSSITLFIVASLVILLHVIVMMSYSRRFPPTSNVAAADAEEIVLLGPHPAVAAITTAAEDEPTVWSGIHLILKHNYVLLILGVSCLYEVSLTCLNYQMTLLGWSRFEESPSYNPNDESSSSSNNNSSSHFDSSNMSFTQFMGHYGQMVNVSSLLLSSLIFPFLIRRVGLKYTLRLFPTLLLIANIIAFGALPGNLAALFVSISLLKAMTYSIHDPAKEILYIPTSNAIKFKAKFWIDVVGARFAKAIGSSINHYSGSVSRSIRVASAPSLLTAAALWYVCYRVGTQFEDLVENGTIVGVDDDPLRLRTNSSSNDHREYSGEHDEDGDDCGYVHETEESMELTAL